GRGCRDIIVTVSDDGRERRRNAIRLKLIWQRMTMDVKRVDQISPLISVFGWSAASRVNQAGHNDRACWSLPIADRRNAVAPAQRSNHASTPRRRSASRGPKPALHVEVGYLQRIADDELAPRLDHVAHEGAEHLGRLLTVADLDLQQRAERRIERGLPKLLRI